MLKQLLTLIAEDELRTPQELAEALAVPVPLVAQMVAQLARAGYLSESQQCAGGCDGCSLKRVCGSQPTHSLRLWTLTDKGRALVAGREHAHAL